ncbi:hypothetical protein O6H91_06G034800 [Diphasiastrum complanatum]|uniref:Uncharacterized protein n=1 Tax=Diphasiastrum complanatum TaxID=34168 RepID=A0ACC2DC94_DIPCM|nr:hypothetical protein O6H91_06G034800 [Diphasiastrum complanatum]
MDRENEYELQGFDDTLSGSTASRFALFAREFGLRRSSGSALALSRFSLKNFVILPKNRIYYWWAQFVLLWAAYSSFFTPIEFGFFRGLPRHIWFLDFLVQVVFLADIIVNFFVAYKDAITYKMVVQHRNIALRYARTDLVLDILGCLPWDSFYKMSGRKEVIRFGMWVRLYRVRKADTFFQKLEKDIRINYFAARILKLLAVELYCTHTAACIFYYLATTLSASSEGYTWIGSLSLGRYTYHNFREIGLGKRYITALYWAIVTMATVGYGDVHAVNTREMIFVMIYVSFDMILGAYLIGNMTALIVKGSNTEKYRDKMTMVIKYSNRHNLAKHIRAQMKNHIRLQFESKFTEESITNNFPVAIRAKISQALYHDILEQVYLFKNCSYDFMNETVTRLHEEYFLPGEVIVEQGTPSDQLYIVSYGILEEVLISEDGMEEIISKLEPQSVFGEITVLCNIPQPYTVRVCELCKVLRLDKQSFTNVMQMCFLDARQVTMNLVEKKTSDVHLQKLATDVASTLTKQDAELALRVNAAAFHGDFRQLEHLVKAGADLERTDYDGKTALHLAASKGHQDIILYLIREGCNVNRTDNYGNSPLLEAVTGGHDGTISILVEKGASLQLKDSAMALCNAVINGDIELLRRLLRLGVNPNSTDHNLRTPLHIAAADGSFIIVKLLLDAGANIFAKDRWGHTPYTEGQGSGSSAVMNLFNEALQNTRMLLPSQAESFAVNSNILDKRIPLQGQSDLFPIAYVHTENSSPKDTGLEASGHSFHPENLQAEQCISQRDVSTLFDNAERSLIPSHLSQYNMNLESSNSLYRHFPIDKQEDAFKEHEKTKGSSSKNNLTDDTPGYSHLRRRCTIFPYHPWTPAERRKHGVVIWVPETLRELLDMASEIFGEILIHIMNEDAGVVTSIDLIDHDDKLYIINDELIEQARG